MIPSVFISSTITDLHYLRDALRDAIVELAYRPVMSDYGEVGYLSPNTAADSCYRTVSQCQLVVLIVGRKYGKPAPDGYSVTHREFLTAKEKGVPIITFAEAEILAFKQVYDSDKSATLWKSFAQMDNPQGTFEFLDEIRAAPTFNSCLAFQSAGDAKRILKAQIADFVGDRLSEIVRPLKTEVQDVLAEVKAMRQELQRQPNAKNMDQFVRVYRLLLNDKAAVLRKLLEQLFGDIDAAIQVVIADRSLEAIVSDAGYKLTVTDNDELAKWAFLKDPNPDRKNLVVHARNGADGAYIIFRDKRVEMSTKLFKAIDELLYRLHEGKSVVF